VSAPVVTALLRDPKDIAQRCERSEGLGELALASIACLVIGAALFGGVLGSFRGGLQIGFSLIKLPLALLTTLVVSVPAFFALTVGLGGRSSFRTTAALTLAASARAALVMAGSAPLLWLLVDRGLAYHQAVLLATVVYLAAGVAALGIALRGLGGSFRALVTAAACGLVFLGVFGQTAWMLRPFFGRPSQHSIPFVRAREGSFADSLVRSSKSAMGIYDSPRLLREASESGLGETSR
jgi:hypothetical protein